MRAKTVLRAALFSMLVSGIAYCVVRKNSTWVRPGYPPVAMTVNPAGTCVLSEYNFRGGERWSWMDPYAWFVMAPGDAFYTVTYLRTGKLIRDSTTQIWPPITAYSLVSVAMGHDIFYWSQDGTAANFPGAPPDYFFEWTDIKECAGTTRQSEYASVSCRLDSTSGLCAKLRARLSPRPEGTAG
jgi:hypothetical protein